MPPPQPSCALPLLLLLPLLALLSLHSLGQAQVVGPSPSLGVSGVHPGASAYQDFAAALPDGPVEGAVRGDASGELREEEEEEVGVKESGEAGWSEDDDDEEEEEEGQGVRSGAPAAPAWSEQEEEEREEEEEEEQAGAGGRRSMQQDAGGATAAAGATTAATTKEAAAVATAEGRELRKKVRRGWKKVPRRPKASSNSSSPPPPPSGQDPILATLISAGCSKLAGYIDSSGFTASLSASSGTRPWTLFAPKDTAFASLPATVTQRLASASAAKLKSLIAQQHIVPSPLQQQTLTGTPYLVSSTQLSSQTLQSVSSSGTVYLISNWDSEVYTVTLPPIVSNASLVVYLIGGVLLPAQSVLFA